MRSTFVKDGAVDSGLGERTPASTAASAHANPGLRTPVAVVLSRFPLITETFILREIVELERQGQPVRLVPLLRERPRVMHREAARWVETALYTPFLSTSILRANLNALRRQPRRLLGLLARLIAKTASSGNLFLRTLALFPKSVYLAERLHKEGIRHIHAHFATHPSTAALIISELTDITFSFTGHAHDLFVRQQLLDWKLERATWVRVISDFNRQFLLSKYPELSAEKVKVIHTGIEANRYRALGAEAPDSPAAPSQRPTPQILCIAALKPYKGLTNLMAACAELRRGGLVFSCQIVGDGPARRSLQRLIERHRLEESVHLLGPLPQDRVAELLIRCDLVVQPSVVAPDGQMEGIPVALMEAMAAGKPVVATRLSGIPELVEDGQSGLLVEPGEALALARAIGELIGDPPRAAAMGRCGQRKVEASFDLTTVVGELICQIERSSPRLAELEKALRSFPDTVQQRLSGLALGWLRAQTNSTVAGLKRADSVEQAEVVLKVHNSVPGDDRSAAERARHEWRVLERLQTGAVGQALSDDLRFAAPRPLALAESRAALLMEPALGSPLTEALRRARLPWSRDGFGAARSVVVAAGRWLRMYQRKLDLPPLSVSAQQALRAGAAEHLSHLPDLDAAARERVIATLDELLSDQETPPEWIRPQHGDFWPGNIFEAKEILTVLDFEAAYLGLALEDAAYFLLHLRLYLDYPLLRPRLEVLERDFLGACFEGETIDRRLWAACRIAAAARILRFGRELDNGWPARRRRRLLLDAMGAGA